MNTLKVVGSGRYTEETFYGEVLVGGIIEKGQVYGLILDQFLDFNGYTKTDTSWGCSKTDLWFFNAKGYLVENGIESDCLRIDPSDIHKLA